MAHYDALISEDALRTATRTLFQNEHYPQAVSQAFKVVNKVVRKKSGIADDGYSLMNRAFSEQSPPVAITPRRTKSEQDQHNGYRMILAGSMLGIRNPYAHELDLPENDARGALELLAIANHLLKVVGNSRRVRKRSVAPRPKKGGASGP